VPEPEPAPAPEPEPAEVLPADEISVVPYTPPPAAKKPQLTPQERAIRKQRRAGMGMMIAGWSLFGVSYLITAAIGAAAIDAANDRGPYTDPNDDEYFNDPPNEAYGQRLLIPLVGPFIATSEANSATAAYVTVLGGTVQVAGLTLGIVGTVMYAKAKRRNPRIAVGGAPLRGGGQLTLGGRF
jgi:hypothetical protein